MGRAPRRSRGSASARVEDLLRHYPYRWLDLRESAPLGVVAARSRGHRRRHGARGHRQAPEAAALHHRGRDRRRHRRARRRVVQPAVSGAALPAPATAWPSRARCRWTTASGRCRRRSSSASGRATTRRGSGRILPVHPATEGLSSNWVRRLVAEALDAYGDVPDTLPALIRVRRDLMPLGRVPARHPLPAGHRGAATPRGGGSPTRSCSPSSSAWRCGVTRWSTNERGIRTSSTVRRARRCSRRCRSSSPTTSVTAVRRDPGRHGAPAGP